MFSKTKEQRNAHTQICPEVEEAAGLGCEIKCADVKKGGDSDEKDQTVGGDRMMQNCRNAAVS